MVTKCPDDFSPLPNVRLVLLVVFIIVVAVTTTTVIGVGVLCMVVVGGVGGWHNHLDFSFLWLTYLCAVPATPFHIL
jgi:hypothetical protein